MTTAHYKPAFNLSRELEHYQAYAADMAHRIIDRRDDLNANDKQRLHDALSNNWPHTAYRNVY